MKTKSFGWNFTGWSVIAFYTVCGVLLLLWPGLALTVATITLAAVLCIVGLVHIIGYVRGDTLEGLLGYGLTKGLVLVLVGLMLAIRPEILTTALPILWGVAMVAGGLAKIQMASDLRRIDHKRWWWMLLGALVSFVLGAFSIAQPAFLALAVTQFAGISLLVEAVLDASAMLLMKRQLKQLKWNA